MSTKKHALVALGANLPLGDMPPKTIVNAAIAAFSRIGFNVQYLSKLYQTPCFPKGAGPDYVNAAVTVAVPATMSAAAVLASLHQIESDFGRERVQRWGMRTLDLDLIALDDLVLPDLATYLHWRDLAPEAQSRTAPDQLILPHPRLADRAFVLVPLADVAPNWRHPVTGATVAQMLAALPAADRAEVIALDVD